MKEQHVCLAHYSAALSIGIILVSSTLTLAQPVRGDNRASMIEEVTVTARRVEESLQDTPVSVSAFNQGELEQLGIAEIRNLSQAAPNLDVRRVSGGQPAYSFSIRGISNQDDNVALDGTVGVYVDGVYIGRQSSSAFALFDVERIEVLRGPQGTLFGRNTIGGAINIVTLPPSETFTFKQKVSVGNRGHREFVTAIDTGRHNDLAARFSVLDSEHDGDIRELLTGRNLNESDVRGWRFALNWTPSDVFQMDYSVERSKWRSVEPASQLTFVRDDFANSSGMFYGGPIWEQARAEASEHRRGRVSRTPKSSRDMISDIDGHALTFTWDVSPDMTFKSITGYREWREETPSAVYGGAFAADGVTLFDVMTMQPIPAGSLVPLYEAGGRDRGQRQWSQEFQLFGTLLDERLRYTTGLYYFKETSTLLNPQSFVIPACMLPDPNIPGQPLLPCGNSVVAGAPFLDVRTDNRAYAVYGEFTYELVPDLDLTLGYRYSVDKRRLDLTNVLDETVQRVTPSDSWNNFSPSAVLSYRWSDALNTYFKVVTGYRSGGFNLRSTSVESALRPFDEETVISYELGWKSDLFDRTLRFNGALFYMDYEDRQISQFMSGSTGAAQILVNAGKSINSGVELEMTWLPTAGLKISANYGYTHVDYKEFVAAEVDPVSGFPTGVNVDIADSASTNQNTPKHNGSLSVEYALAPWQFGQLTLRADRSYTGSISFHPQYTLYNSSDAFWLTNARATLADIPMGRDARLSISLWGQNLENKKYREFGLDWGQLGFATNTYGPLRAYGIDFIYEFGRHQ